MIEEAISAHDTTHLENRIWFLFVTIFFWLVRVYTCKVGAMPIDLCSPGPSLSPECAHNRQGSGNSSCMQQGWDHPKTLSSPLFVPLGIDSHCLQLFGFLWLPSCLQLTLHSAAEPSIHSSALCSPPWHVSHCFSALSPPLFHANRHGDTYSTTNKGWKEEESVDHRLHTY